MKHRKWLVRIGIAAVVTVGLVLTYLHSIQMFASDPVYQTRRGALDGYDPVAYFTQSRPVLGREDTALEWTGAVWHFASGANRELFRNDPSRYAPQFGGYCAYAVASGYTARTKPEAWKIVDGRLYLNFDLKTRDQWLAQAGDFIERGNRNWPRVIQD
jgi:hypothetical protein